MCVYHGVDQIRRITIQLYSNSKNFVRRYCSIVNLFVCSTRESGSGCSILIEYSFVSPRVSPKIIKFTYSDIPLNVRNSLTYFSIEGRKEKEPCEKCLTFPLTFLKEESSLRENSRRFEGNRMYEEQNYQAFKRERRWLPLDLEGSDDLAARQDSIFPGPGLTFSFRRMGEKKRKKGIFRGQSFKSFE